MKLTFLLQINYLKIKIKTMTAIIFVVDHVFNNISSCVAEKTTVTGITAKIINDSINTLCTVKCTLKLAKL